MNRLRRLTSAGVSIWLDDLSRELLESGEFERLVRERSVTGATSNPAIFARAVSGSRRYDDQIGHALASGVDDPREIFLELALEDVRRAAAMLRPAYEVAQGRDGFVSFECTPDLADDAEATVMQALEVLHRLDLPNVLIKVAATDAGIRAIQELTAGGVSVNVTLLFSMSRYEQAIGAYLDGLERRAAAGRSVAGISSVASFFVSRVDAAVDERLPPGSALRGRIAIANAQRAYALYLRARAGKRWKRLESLGAHPQRPLWASTATKDPAYSDVRYLEGLVTPDAIATVPLETLDAFRAHGEVLGPLGGDAGPAERLVAALDADVDLKEITTELELAGVESFRRSYRQALDCVEAGVSRLRAAAELVSAAGG